MAKVERYTYTRTCADHQCGCSESLATTFVLERGETLEDVVLEIKSAACEALGEYDMAPEAVEEEVEQA